MLRRGPKQGNLGKTQGPERGNAIERGCAEQGKASNGGPGWSWKALNEEILERGRPRHSVGARCDAECDMPVPAIR